MTNVIDLCEFRRARLGKTRWGRSVSPVDRRARTNRRGENGSFVRIGEVSDALLRRLTE